MYHNTFFYEVTIMIDTLFELSHRTPLSNNNALLDVPYCIRNSLWLSLTKGFQ